MAVTGLGAVASPASLTSPWTLVIPAALHALGVAGALPADPTVWGEHLLILLAGYLAAGALLLSARAAGVHRLPTAIGWVAGLVLLSFMGALQWWVAQWFSSLLGTTLLGLAGQGLAMAALVWLGAGAFAWSLHGRISDQARRRKLLHRVSSRLVAMEQVDRVRLEGSLRGMLTSLGRQVSKVVTDVTLNSPVDEVEFTRSLPDSTKDFVAPLTARVSQSWAPEAESEPASPRLAEVVTAPGPIATAALVIVSALATLSLSAESALAVVIAAVITGGLAAVAWWAIPRRLDIPEQRLIVTIVASIGLAAAVLWLPVLLVNALDGQMAPVWTSVVIAVVGVAGLATVSTLSTRLWLMRQGWTDRVASQVAHCDELGRKIAVIHQIDPRVLYSATLGTLIRTTVDLTATDVTEERRETALREMTRSITGELDTLRLQHMPLPDEQILGTLGMWKAALGVDAEVSPSLFSQVAWSAEGLGDLSAAVGTALIWGAQQHRGVTTLKLDSDGTEVTIDLAIEGLAPLFTVDPSVTRGEPHRGHWSIGPADGAGTRGTVLRGVLVPRNGDATESFPRFAQPSSAAHEQSSEATGLVESSSV